jgi:hypothetical protein
MRETTYPDVMYNFMPNCDNSGVVRVYSTLTYILVNYDTVAKVWTNVTY